MVFLNSASFILCLNRAKVALKFLRFYQIFVKLITSLNRAKVALKLIFFFMNKDSGGCLNRAKVALK